MSNDEEFQKKLAMGTAAENIVYDYLKANHSLVQDMRYQVHEKGSGPRLEGTEGKIVLPDFAVWNKSKSKGNFLVDVKAKTSLYPELGTKCFTVDKKFNDYIRCRDIMQMDFLQLVFVYEGKMYFYKDNESIGVVYYNNEYGTGATQCFEFNESNIRY